MQWMIYGANGYTGRLIAQQAKSLGMHPLIAGRHPQKIADLAQELGLESVVFDLAKDSAEPYLKEMDLVLNCAGPFSSTIKPMLDACIKTKTHYLDITGEIGVFEYVHQQSDKLKSADIVAIPGVGFDVVPSDCLALQLKEKLPDANQLTLAFHPGGGGPSRGTSKTMIEYLPKGGAVRKDGKITSVTVAYKERTIPFGCGSSTAFTIPWGDVSTAFYSTGIPNIEVYLAAPAKTIRRIKLMRLGRHFLKIPGVISWAQKQVDKQRAGPSEKARESNFCYLYGEVSNGKDMVKAGIKTPEGYKLTSLTAVAAVQAFEKNLMNGPRRGALTPSVAFGKDFINSISGVEAIPTP